ncbi:chromosome segregation protein SMC [Saxibacter everestensis]|uniref:Chromosome partition protein Smc n=1 Tax=Saxibacter everestensis TaxID=2909229 RepID=A0ABY8QVK0_9MICO|nr:chromosome segregation protein SMC [Brevibacteriaceae bacterium ZFBP1038]
MHLKTLTLRGFKSFASATTLQFEPGVTCVVGPNGSGKSNVVDALSWVMGEQGVKSLRGGKMEDVIFAGTSGRAPLGRAEVSLTIDNTDGALPIEYTEVTISRTLFRSGGSEYAINGTPARLLDIQDLLSDSGLGREMHVIVGQGQLDTVLRATPEDRRGFIEEAAGVLKHRKRKEKAVRKLEAMQANLTRLNDLTSEIRRQLGPLGRQADIARRAQTVQIAVRDARARLLADDLVQLTANLQQEVADESALRAKRASVEKSLAVARTRHNHLEKQLAEAAPELSRHRDTWYRLSSLQERVQGLGQLASERIRLLGTGSQQQETGRDPDELEGQAKKVAAEEAALKAEVAGLQTALDEAVAERNAAEAAHGAEEKRIAGLIRAAADRREGLARLTGVVAAQRSRVEASEAEIGRLRESLAEAHKRHFAAQEEFTLVENQVAGVEEGEEGLDQAHEEALAALEAVQAKLDGLIDRERELEGRRNSLQARIEALHIGLARKDGAGALLESETPGLLGLVTELVAVEAGYETAITAALGQLALGVAAESVDTAVDSIRFLKDNKGGLTQVLVAGGQPSAAATHRTKLTGEERWAIDVVTPAASVAAPINRLLSDIAIVPGLAEARELIAAHPQLTAVTTAGDVLSGTVVSGGSQEDAPSLLQLQTAYAEAEGTLDDVTSDLERTRFELKVVREDHAAAKQAADGTLEGLHSSDARLAAVAEQLGQLGSAARSASAEAERAEKAIASTETALAVEREKLSAAVSRLADAESAPDDAAEPSTAERDRLAAVARTARAADMDARLALRTGEERVKALSSRVQSLQHAARTERVARERAAERAEQRRRQAATAQAVAIGAERLTAALSASVRLAAEERDVAERQHGEGEEQLAELRKALDALQAELAELTDTVHRDEVARTQQKLRIEALETKAIEELGISAEKLMEEFGPDKPVPVFATPARSTGTDDDEDADTPEQIPYVRSEQEKRLKKAERDLSQLGRVNPLALEEFAALEERHKFLETQLDDLKKSRRDLLDIVREVDERVEQVFTAAFHDTATQFERVFGRLFPGGEGRLVLTDPDDMLTTGIEVEARPAGKKVKRLSLLSGGERSLTAVALLVAIFKARPSPFYVMDEVEAALDDTNLSRLITIFEELRESSQLIVITHQKRTMEVADALYGVTMRGDGVTTVISQRLRDLT